MKAFFVIFEESVSFELNSWLRISFWVIVNSFSEIWVFRLQVEGLFSRNFDHVLSIGCQSTFFDFFEKATVKIRLSVNRTCERIFDEVFVLMCGRIRLINNTTKMNQYSFSKLALGFLLLY